MTRLTLSLLCVLLLSAVPSSQATGSIVLDFGNAQTISVNATQRAKLQRLLDDSNAARVARTPALPAQTLEQWLRVLLLETVQQQIRQAEAHEQAEACAAFQGLGAGPKAQIIAALGNKSPCR